MKPLYFFIIIFMLFSCEKGEKSNNITKQKQPKSTIKFGLNIDNYKVVKDTIKRGESFGVIMDRHKIDYSKINEIVTTIKDTFDVRQIRTGKKYLILKSKDSLETPQVFIYKHNKINATVIHFADSIIKAYTHKKPIKIVEREVSGKITSNFSEAMDSLGLGHTLAYNVADIYSWTLDFFRLQKNDNFKIIFEEKYINDSIKVGYGKIKAAVFNHNGKNLYAYRFVADTIRNIPEYYDENAELLRRQFLKSPIKFQYRISSRYNLRRRIKLYGNRVRAHKGTDFAARYGTPIMTTASGTVVESARKGGNGNFVKVRHNNTYSTQYLHMKKRKVKVGDYVRQGEIIGWVGMTGNTSGPHVCYRFWKNGRQVDPFKQSLPPAKPMNKEIKPKFFEFIKPLKQQLDDIELSDDSKNEDGVVLKN